MTDKDFFNLALELSTEFDKYILSHPEIAEKIPQDALIVFLLEDDPEFNKKSIEVSNKQREINQEVVVVKVQTLLPPFESRLVNPKLEFSPAF